MSKNDLINYWENSGLITDERLLNAFRKVRRENFVLDKKQAYHDMALPILNKQTISQPSTIMIMLQALELNENDKVLEIGTGSGYNLALICRMVKRIVYSVEIHKELIEFAKGNLKKSKINNFEIFHQNGYFGLKKYAPFDKIILTAAPNEIPLELIKQLKIDGIMVAPIGKYTQRMLKIINKKDGLIKQDLGDFVFVPMVE
ncbi:protein-L-isoaspartate(D-aspartate) O-methyltransferase [Candidatus Woesearchaeota archaeon]|nr:protein-L-isoaspartate(D-aspartate) O-methyltransferase [Candidatus Woesearchaeota archaeon]